jgi:chloride channel 3/4/5
MMACGAGCGVAVAFGSPIGGALFIYEISKPNTFWTFSMLWRVFTATSIATFTLSILESLSSNSPLSLSDSGALKLGNLSFASENSMLDLPAGIILGIICGLLGALFIGVSIRLGMLRKIYINTSIRKVLEAITFAFVTASIFYLIVMIWSYNCIQITIEDSEHLFQFYCTEPNTYNPLATLVFNTEGGTIR